MDISVIQNNLGMWICAAFMIAIILIQAVLYLKLSRKEATTLGLPAEQQKEAMRSAAVTAVGPALALSIMLITLMTTLGGPTAWMRMNDVGSGRSELAIASMVSDMVTAAEGTPEWDLQNFSYAVWAQGIDVAGWLVGAMVTIALGGKLTRTLNEKFDAKWVKLLMAGCLVSLFTYLLLNTVYQKTSPYIAAAVFGAIIMDYAMKNVKYNLPLIIAGVVFFLLFKALGLSSVWITLFVVITGMFVSRIMFTYWKKKDSAKAS